ncbi:MAG: carbon-nitrogen hydrolase family protein [Acidimicrobiia bacterium]
MRELKLALVQCSAGTDFDANVEHAIAAVRRAADGGAQLVALPENFHLRLPSDGGERKLEVAQEIPGPLSRALSDVARDKGIYLLAGSFSEQSDVKGKVHNTSLLFDPSGSVIAKYRKIHMFDVTIAGQVKAQESQFVEAGAQVVTADTEFGRVGLSVCYDLRFPELYRALAVKGAVVTFVPANFTLFTGRDHWETLLRARAIENGMFVVAPGQIGGVQGGFTAYGRSMVVDPWGTVVACASDGQEILHARIDLDLVDQVRAKLPSLQHRRPEAYRS